MTLTMRPTGCRHRGSTRNWTIFGYGEPVGRIYEDASASTPRQVALVLVGDADAGIVTSGKTSTLERTKAEFQRSWAAVRAAASV